MSDWVKVIALSWEGLWSPEVVLSVPGKVSLVVKKPESGSGPQVGAYGSKASFLQGSGGLVCVLTGGAGHKMQRRKRGRVFFILNSVPEAREFLLGLWSLERSKRGQKRSPRERGRLLAATWRRTDVVRLLTEKRLKGGFVPQPLWIERGQLKNTAAPATG